MRELDYRDARVRASTSIDSLRAARDQPSIPIMPLAHHRCLSKSDPPRQTFRTAYAIRTCGLEARQSIALAAQRMMEGAVGMGISPIGNRRPKVSVIGAGMV